MSEASNLMKQNQDTSRSAMLPHHGPPLAASALPPPASWARKGWNSDCCWPACGEIKADKTTYVS